MAARLTDACPPDDIDQLLYLKNAQGLYRGFKTGFISQNLTKMEGYLMTCTRCKGIIRDASSCEGETVCKLCNTNQLNPKRVQKVRNSVAELKIKCPLLRDCGWSGKLLEGEKHLKECGSFLITCPLGCRNVIKRCEMNDHLTAYCLQREVNCEYCDLSITFKNLTEHLLTCPAHPIVCKCRRSTRRDEVEEHIDKDCELTEVECPYAKYSCKIGKIPRKDLLAHKKEFYIEHQDMIERENCLLAHKLEKCNFLTVQRHELMEGKMGKEIDQSMRKHELMKKNMKTKNDQLVRNHTLLEGKMETKHNQLIQKHNFWEGKMETKHNQLIKELCLLKEKYAQLRKENYQMVQEIRFRKRLIGTTIDLDLNSNFVISTEFGNGLYTFICEILTSSSLDTRRISLIRLPTCTYSDKNVLCITHCVLCLQGTTEIAPYYLDTKLLKRIETDSQVPIDLISKSIMSLYRQQDGIVKMEIYFDYDYVTYKGFLGIC